MADTRSIEAKRMHTFENVAIFSVLAIVVVYICLNYYEHPWYYTQRYLFVALDFLPDMVNQVLFAWQPKAADMIPMVANDLVFHAKDYSQYYIGNEVGIRKKIQMDRLTLTMFAPYAIVPIFWMIVKEFKVNRSQIKGLGEKGGVSALYRYAKSQAEIWPYIKPVVNVMDDMVSDVSLDNGWYALSKLPLDWMEERGLLKVITAKKRRELLTVKQRAEFSLDRRKAYKELMENLGPVWSGIDALDFNYKCVLAVLVSQVFGQIAKSRLLNRKLCNYYESKKSPESKKREAALLESIQKEVDGILEKYRKSFELPYFDETQFDEPFDPIMASFRQLSSEVDMYNKGAAFIEEVLLKHAYVKTVLFALYERSWVYGVLASAEFLWVKTVDRDLWYILSQQGRTSSFIEVSGCWAHYLAESAYGFRTLMPQMEEGLRSLDFDLWSTHDNVIAHGVWDNQSKWDKLVPDAMGKAGALPRGPQGINASKVV